MKTKKRECIKKNNCVLAEFADETSKECIFKNRTKRCRNIKKTPAGVIKYHGFHVKKNVKDFLEKITKKSHRHMVNMVKKEGYIAYGDTDEEIKNNIIKEILQSGYYGEVDRQNYVPGLEDVIISLKIVKEIIKDDKVLFEILHTPSNWSHSQHSQ